MYLLINHKNEIKFDEGSWFQDMIYEFSGRYISKKKLPEKDDSFVDEICDVLSKQEKEAYLLFSGYFGKISTYKEIAEHFEITLKEAKQLVAHAKTKLRYRANLIEDHYFRISPAGIKSYDLMLKQQLFDFLTGNPFGNFDEVFEHLLNNSIFISSDLSSEIAEEISELFNFHTNSLLILKKMIPEFENKLVKMEQEKNDRLIEIMEDLKNKQKSKDTIIHVEIMSKAGKKKFLN